MTTRRFPRTTIGPLLAVGALLSLLGVARGEGRAGSVEWSDGHKVAGTLSLTPGKGLKLFTSRAQVSIQLVEVKEMRFKPEKEELWEGFYFPTPGQTTQVKTGEVYPIRYLQTEITLSDGKVLDGHLFTTMLYVETDDATQKVPLVAKQTGTNGEKLTELIYPTVVRFDADASAAGSTQIDLSHAAFSATNPPVVVTKPDLSLLPPQQVGGKPVWTVPERDSSLVLFGVEAADGIHVSWPATEAPPEMEQAVNASLKEMRDFYDTRTLLGCFADVDAGDIYSLVMLKRMGTTYSFDADKKPWSLVILRWKYDPDQKKTTLLNRTPLVTGRVEGNSQPPVVFKEAGLLTDFSAISPTSAPGASP